MKLRFKIASCLIVLIALKANAQQDSIPKNNKLDEVIVTGQYNPQSVRKSVFQVTVISRADIDRQAGNNLADLLNQTLNINIIPNNSTGKSSVKLFGLGGDYFKILVDNVPVINDEGLGDNTDLTQMNLDDVQQIEIVEGSMGVEYGANAVSGIINIITKKSSTYKWEITPYIQEETIGDEYNVSDKGRHIQSLKVGHNFSNKFYANAMVTSNDFKGYYNGRKGENYLMEDGLRGYEWLPKNQLTAKSLLSYNLKNHRIFYKFEYLYENTERYNSFVLPNYDVATETTNPTAADDIFTTKRFYHNLNASGRFESLMNYDFSFSYQQQERDIAEYNYVIRTGEKKNYAKYKYESRDGLYSKGNFSNFLKNETIDFQLGYEVSEIDGYSQSTVSGINRGKVDRMLGSYDAYISTEVNLTKKLSLRPGVRALFSSQFNTQAAVSFSAKYAFENGYELRGIIGTAPKLPSYDELYTYFVDVNHNVQGNENLNPEQGKSAFLHLNKIFTNTNEIKSSAKFSAWFIDVKDRIELIVVSQTPLSYKYSNIDIFRTWGTSLTSSIDYHRLTLNAGVTFSGVSKVIAESDNYSDDYLYGVQANLNASYTIPKWQTVFSVFAKYHGADYLFVVRNDGSVEKGKQNDYSMIDGTIKKALFSNKLEVTAGVRNILDVTSVNTTAQPGGAHSGPPVSQLLGYGRSYFLKLLYKFNF